MPLTAPRLDGRTYDDILEAARARIRRYSSDWTDFNDGDPGMVLVQLFAWLTESMLYQLNRVPERNYVKFLELLGMELEAPRPARAWLTFEVNPKADRIGPVPAATRIGGADPVSGDQVVFETERGLDLFPRELVAVEVFDGSARRDLSTANGSRGDAWAPLGVEPRTGSALYLGFAPSELELERYGDGQAVVARLPQAFDLFVFLPEGRDEGRPLRRGALSASTACAAPVASATSVRLQWEYHPADDPRSWRALGVRDDATGELRRSGAIQLAGPRDMLLATDPEQRADGPLFWLRARLARGPYPSGEGPVIDAIRPNVVAASHLATVGDELLGDSTGLPGQELALRRTPVAEGTLVLEVRPRASAAERWTEVDDLRAAGPDARVYTLDPGRGLVRFGDGRFGRVPEPEAEVVAVRYRYGGGEAGNLPTDTLTTLLSSVPGVQGVTNERPAVGGSEEQRLEDLMAEAPGRIRRAERAVTAEDFAGLAEEIGGVAQARAVALAHPEHPETPVPGAVTVYLVADSQELPPRPSDALLAAVADALDERRLVTTELFVRPAVFVAVQVVTTVTADPRASFGEVQQAVQRRLAGFLSPVPVAPEPPGPAEDGEAVVAPPSVSRRFGADLALSDFFRVVLEVPGVVAIERLSLHVDGVPYDDLSQPKRVPAQSVAYGVRDHDITVRPAVDR